MTTIGRGHRRERAAGAAFGDDGDRDGRRDAHSTVAVSATAAARSQPASAGAIGSHGQATNNAIAEAEPGDRHRDDG